MLAGYFTTSASACMRFYSLIHCLQEFLLLDLMLASDFITSVTDGKWLLLLLLCLGLSGLVGPLPMRGNKLFRSLGYRSNSQLGCAAPCHMARSRRRGGGNLDPLPMESGQIYCYRFIFVIYFSIINVGWWVMSRDRNLHFIETKTWCQITDLVDVLIHWIYIN